MRQFISRIARDTRTNHPSSLAPPRRLSQPTSHTHQWLLSPGELVPGLTASDFVTRRNEVCARIPIGTCALIPAPPQRFSSGDVPYLYRPCASIRYLTSVCERDTLMLLSNDRATLYTAQRDSDAELWDGPRIGADRDVIDWLQCDVRSMQFFADDLSRDVKKGVVNRLLLDVERHPDFANVVEKSITRVGRKLTDLLVKTPSPTSVVDSQRLIKSDAEIVLLRRAAQAISGGLNDAMAQLVGDVHERDIATTIHYSAMRRGGDRPAFPSVVAGGVNATTLHYMANDQIIHADELVMVDAGCEVFGYCSDVSRSWPVGGKFSTAQRKLYELVLDVQKRAIERSIPGVSIEELHVFVASELTAGLLGLGFMPGHSLESALESGAYAKYYPHATGHYLGMDVHDTHNLPKTIPLMPGMVITVEPGLYITNGDLQAPSEFWGIGMRIEDDLVVRESGLPPDVLSIDAVKEVDEIERLVGSSNGKWKPF